jgi:hypothetical protein
MGRVGNLARLLIQPESLVQKEMPCVAAECAN